MRKRPLYRIVSMALVVCGAMCVRGSIASAADLAEIRQRGVLRHLGVVYANFVRQTHEGADGLDVELTRRFAARLGLRYTWVPTTWTEAFGDLTGQRIRSDGNKVIVIGKTRVRGDILANGLTILPWRQKVVDFSIPTFPTGVWLVARADSPIQPIQPSGDIATDIQRVMGLLSGRSVLAMKGTCLDPGLYDLAGAKAQIRLLNGSRSLNDLAPAVINGEAESTLLDIPNALIALQKWPGKLKVVGPVSPLQFMAVAVAKSSPQLLEAFNRFFQECWRDGTYETLVRKYYPAVFLYLGDFFASKRKE